MIQKVLERHIKTAAGKPYMNNHVPRDMWITKARAYAGEAAMLYSIDASANKSKYYEILVTVADDGQATVWVMNGRLGTDTKPREHSRHRDLDSAKRALAKIKRSKINGRSHYIDAFESKAHKTPDGKQLPKGQYPIGLSKNPGSWRNQDDMLACKPVLKKLVEKINEAVADADNEDMSSVLEDLQAASGMVNQLGRSSMAEEIKKKLKAPLARLQGGGRHRVDPVKTIRELKSLSRYVSKQMSTCMTASVLERVAVATNGWGPASDGKNYSVSWMRPQASNNNTGPWVIGWVTGTSGTGFAVEATEWDYNRVIKAVRRKVYKDYNEANKLMYDHFSSLPGVKKYDANTGAGPWGRV